MAYTSVELLMGARDPLRLATGTAALRGLDGT